LRPPLDNIGNNVQNAATKHIPHVVNRPSEDTTKPARPVLLANPATRGRKAAKETDAAGQIPQTIVPANPIIEPDRERRRPIVSLSRASDDIDLMAGEPNHQTSAVKHLPGFSRANGGPWSREAHDLLGSKRPV
jgi:hypothetical protein